MIYLYLFGTCFHFIYVFMIIGNYILVSCSTKYRIVHWNKRMGLWEEGIV